MTGGDRNDRRGARGGAAAGAGRTGRVVLVVAPWWHGADHPGRVRVERFVRAVSETGGRACIVAAGDRDARTTMEHAEVITVADPLRLYASPGACSRDGGGPGARRRRPSRLRRALAYRVFAPDPSVVWAMRVARNAHARAAAARADAVLASSPPESVHVAALRLAAIAGAATIVDLRDGWLDDPLRELLRRSAFRRWREGRIERRVVRRASRVLVTSDVWREMLVRRYPADAGRVVVMPNAYPLEAATKAADVGRCPLCADRPPGADPGGVGETLRLLHAGRFTASRSTQRPELLMGVLELLGVDVELECVGDLTDADRAVLAARRRGVRVRLREPVERAVLLRHLPHAAGLVLLAVSRAAVPAKWFEYVAAGRPILAVTPRESATWRLGKALPRMACVDPAAPDATTLARFVEACRRPGVDRSRPVAFEESTIRRRFVDEVLSRTR